MHKIKYCREKNEERFKVGGVGTIVFFYFPDFQTLSSFYIFNNVNIVLFLFFLNFFFYSGSHYIFQTDSQLTV